MDDLKSVQTSGGSGGTAAAALFGRDGTRKTAGMDVEESTGTMGVLRV